jgi:hypothetical protein
LFGHPIKQSGNVLRILGLIVLLVPYAGKAQDAKLALPRVTSMGVPVYPPLGRAAHVAGIVHIKITTDGKRVSATHIEDGNKLLAVAAEDNIKTWQFSEHEPVTFTTMFEYRLVSNLEGNPSSPRSVYDSLPRYKYLRFLL